MSLRPMIEGLDPRRLLAFIAPDVTWGDDGFVSRADDSSYIGPSRSGGILVANTDFSVREGNTFTIHAYTAAGRPDTAFQTIERTEDAEAGVDHGGRPLVVESSGNGRFTLTRYTATGDRDASFGESAGSVDPGFSPGSVGTAVFYPKGDARGESRDAIASIAAGPDGSVFVLTAITTTTDQPDLDSPEFYLTKFSPAGRPDASFAGGGTLKLPDDFDPPFGSAGWIGVDSHGRVIVATLQRFAFEARRYTAAGVADTAWGNMGVIAGSEFDPLNVTEGGIALDGQDRLLIADQDGGINTPEANSRVLRYTARGRADRTFGTSAQVRAVTVDPDTGRGEHRVVVLPDGSIAAQLGRYVIHVNDDGSPARNGILEVHAGSLYLAGSLADGTLLADGSSVVPGSSVSVARLAPEPAAVVGTSGTLYLTGTAGNDTFRLARTGAADLTVTTGGTTQNVGANVKAVFADLFDGDNVYVDTYFADDADLPSTINAGVGDDSITTGAGADSITTGDGNDTVSAGDGADRIDAGDGSNTVDGGAGGADITVHAFTLSTTNTITGVGSATDRYDFTANAGRAIVSFTGGTITVDTQYADSAVVTLHNSGPATVFGTDGADSITTGDGDDLIAAGLGADTISSGAGNDTVAGDASPSDTPTADRIDLGAGNDTARDGYGNNTILGGDGNDSIRAGGGNDSLSGGLGRDTIRGGDGNDSIDGGGSGDRLFGQDGNDSILGGGGSDLLIGGLGDDTLIGNQGDDLLIAGTPNAARVPAARNHLDGGAGSDAYQLESEDDALASLETRLDTVA